MVKNQNTFISSDTFVAPLMWEPSRRDYCTALTDTLGRSLFHQSEAYKTERLPAKLAGEKYARVHTVGIVCFLCAVNLLYGKDEVHHNFASPVRTSFSRRSASSAKATIFNSRSPSNPVSISLVKVPLPEATANAT